jgi:hypothetical protein
MFYKESSKRFLIETGTGGANRVENERKVEAASCRFEFFEQAAGCRFY